MIFDNSSFLHRRYLNNYLPSQKKEVKSTLAMGAILTLAQAAGLEDYVLYFMIILEVVTLLQYVYNYFQGNPNPNAPKMSDMLVNLQKN